jgi:hypothetical protein
MKRRFLVPIAVVSALAVIPYAVDAQKPTAKKGPPSKSNQVFVKIIWPTEPATVDKDRPVVESWIADELKKRGQSKFTAATAWVPLAEKGEGSTWVWNATLAGKGVGCPVSGRITERAEGRIKVRLDGWSPALGHEVIVSLTDEPGSREIAAGKPFNAGQGAHYVAAFVGPPVEKPAVPSD